MTSSFASGRFTVLDWPAPGFTIWMVEATYWGFCFVFTGLRAYTAPTATTTNSSGIHHRCRQAWTAWTNVIRSSAPFPEGYP